MPQDPFRLRVQKALTAALKEITPANGDTHDLSDVTDRTGLTEAKVVRGRDTFGDGDPLPLVCILEDPRMLDANNADDGYTASSGDYRLFVQGFVEDDRENPTDPAYLLVAEVIRALVRQKKDRFNILGLGDTKPCVESMVIGQPVVRPGDDIVSSVANFYLPVTLKLVEDLEEPFA